MRKTRSQFHRQSVMRARQQTDSLRAMHRGQYVYMRRNVCNLCTHVDFPEGGVSAVHDF